MPNALLLSFHPESNLLSLAIVTLPLNKGFKRFVEDKEAGLNFFLDSYLQKMCLLASLILTVTINIFVYKD